MTVVKSPLFFILLSFLATSASAGPKVCPLPKTYTNSSVEGTVATFADGDTLRVLLDGNTDGKTAPVRLLSIDTPETHFQFGKETYSQGKWGIIAGDRLVELIPVGVRIRIEFEQEVCDVNNRLLGHVFLGNKNINEVMVQEGLAVMYCIFPNTKYCEKFGQHSTAALQAQLGFLGDPSVALPYVFRQSKRGAPPNKFVGNLTTHQVFAPNHMNKVPVGERIFFLTQKDVQAPYQFAKGEEPSETDPKHALE